MKRIVGYEHLLGEEVIIICTDGKIIRGEWSDCCYEEDEEEDNRQEDSAIIDLENGDVIAVYASEIKDIQKAED